MKSFLYHSSLCTLPLLLFASMGIVAGGCPVGPMGGTETNGDTTTTGETTGMTTATLTSTTTAATTTMTTTSSTTPGTSTESTGSESSTDTMAATTDGPPCNMNLLCEEDQGEDIAGCLHDCGTCDDDGTCDPATETPFHCPGDCAPTSCDADGEVDALHEQCDDGNLEDDDGCTSACAINVCGDGHLFADGGEECDDGNTEDSDGCLSTCKVDTRLVFVTSSTVSGNTMGLTGADELCAGAAPEGAGTFMAWLSDGNVGPSSRFGYDGAFVGHFVLTDGTVIAKGWNDLLDGELLSPIDRDENDSKVTGTLVWTNTAINGSPKGTSHCKGWTVASSLEKGHFASTEFSDNTWTDVDLASCASSYRLYCFQVPSP